MSKKSMKQTTNLGRKRARRDLIHWMLVILKPIFSTLFKRVVHVESGRNSSIHADMKLVIIDATFITIFSK